MEKIKIVKTPKSTLLMGLGTILCVLVSYGLYIKVSDKIETIIGT